jgi:SAM-dependent methyltransferase
MQTGDQGPRLMNETIYESGQYLENNPDWHAEDAPFKARWIAEILKRNKVEPSHIVEIGCGSGQILVDLREFFPGARYEGYDISPQAMAIAKPREKAGLAFHQADYLAEATEKPDVLMAIDVFEHVEDYMGFIRAMKPRAQWKVFHIPLDLSAQGIFRGTPMMAARNEVGHLHYFCKDSALATLHDCGYEIADWNYTHGAECLPNRKLRTRLLSVPRRIARSLNEDLAVRVMGGASMMVLAR